MVKSVYTKYPLLILVLGSKNFKSGLLTSIFLTGILVVLFLFNKFFKSDKMFFFRFFILMILVTGINLTLNYFNFEWYIVSKYGVLMFLSVFVVLERILLEKKFKKIVFIVENIIFLIFLSIFREILAFGKIFDKALIKNYDGLLIFNYTSGGLMLLIILLTSYNFFIKKFRRDKNDY